MVSRTTADRAVFLGYHQIGGDRMAVFRNGRTHYAQLPQNLRTE